MVQSLPFSPTGFPLPPLPIPPTPHSVLQHQYAPQNAGWPSVSAGPSATHVTAVRTGADHASPAAALLDALDEVLKIRDPHRLFRAAAEVSYHKLGLMEPALLLLDESGKYLCGTWHMTAGGQISDERGLHAAFGERHREAEQRARNGEGSWCVTPEKNLPRPAPLDGAPLHPPATIITPIMGRECLFGFLENVAQNPDDESQKAIQTRAALLCRALGGQLEDVQRRSRGLPWSALLARRPIVPQSSQEQLVTSVLRTLEQDASISSRKLAVEIGVSPSYLSTVFRTLTGLSLTQYRNRLRLERFFTLADPSGGNLLQAALEAGFGSYPQFHRIFRELLHATPRDYLSLPDRSPKERDFPSGSASRSATSSSLC